jgi:hypothetical protein
MGTRDRDGFVSVKLNGAGTRNEFRRARGGWSPPLPCPVAILG